MMAKARWFLERYPCTMLYLLAMLCVIPVSLVSVSLAVMFSLCAVAAIAWYRHTILRR